MQVRSRMTRDVYTVESDAWLDEVADAMKQMGVRHMPVMEDDQLVGVISDRDILLRAIDMKGKVIVPRVPVRDVMTSDPVVCTETTSIAEIAEVMLARKIDCVPVIEKGELAGLITSSDLIEMLCTAMAGSARQVIPIDFRLHDWKNVAHG